MIARLRGRVADRGVGRVVVDVGGIGFLVHVPTSEVLPGPGEPIELHTSLQVASDSTMTLYGFTDPDSRTLFEQLLRVSGVGPKLALAALSALRPEVLRRAVRDGDVAVLTRVPGIGRKSAQRLILELRGSLAEEEAASGVLAEVRAALEALGYSAAEAQEATADLPADGDVGALLQQALRVLGGAQLTEDAS